MTEMNRLIDELILRSEQFLGMNGPSGRAAKLLSECRDMMQSLVDADGGVASDAELEKHVAWARELLA